MKGNSKAIDALNMLCADLTASLPFAKRVFPVSAHPENFTVAPACP